MKNETQKIVSVFLASFLLLTAIPSLAAEDNDNSKYKDVPPYFMEKISLQQSIEGFVFQSLRPIRQMGANKQVLTKEDILAVEAWQKAAALAYQVQSVLAADMDADGKVTKDEVTNYFRHKNETADDATLARSIEAFMSADSNHDNVIDYDEMRAKTPQNSMGQNSELSKLEDLRATLAGADGPLTIPNVEAQARKVFALIDTDKDGLISREEFAEMRKRSGQVSFYFRSGDDASRCDMPKPADNDIISVFSAYDGAAFSTVSLDSQDEETFAAHVKIEKGDKPIYLVLSSFSPMIWQIDGAKDRVLSLIHI